MNTNEKIATWLGMKKSKITFTKKYKKLEYLLRFENWRVIHWKDYESNVEMIADYLENEEKLCFQPE